MAKKVIKTEKLSDGRELTINSFTGKDMISASRQAKGDSMVMAFALIASRIEIDGKPQVYEDMLSMDGDILTEIMLLVNGDPDSKEAKSNFP